MAAFANDIVSLQSFHACHLSSEVQTLLSAVAFVLCFFLLFQLSQWFRPRNRPWLFLPCVGLEKGWTLARLKTVSRAESMIAQGYSKFSKTNLPFVFPIISNDPLVIVPPACVRDVLNRPETDLEARGPQRDLIQAAYTIQEKEVYMNDFHMRLARKELTRNLPLLTEDIANEIAMGFERYWGSSVEWSTVTVQDSIIGILAGVANRVIAGADLCLKTHSKSVRYSMSVFAGGHLINMTPHIAKPVVGTVAGYVANRHLAICKSIGSPMVLRRLGMNRLKKEGKCTGEPENDGLQWVIDMCYDTGDLKQLDPALIVHRLLTLNNAIVHSASLAMTNTILDLYSSPSYTTFLEVLREESETVLATCGGFWNKDAVAKLHHIDSTIRESMRLSVFSVAFFHRRVLAPKGIDLDGSIHIPKGARLGIPIKDIHHDEEHYPSPTTFDALRFSREQENKPSGQQPGDATDPHQISSAPKQQQQQRDTLTTGSDTFLSFGYGKHSCPGRFFAAHIMKLMLAYVVQNYDVEHMPTRPPQLSSMEYKFPAPKTTIRVRKRQVK